jgi:sugar fermentation stimulation protein A
MKFGDVHPEPLRRAILNRRYKRFLADVELAGGELLTIHCPNTGTMKNCAEPGFTVWYSRATRTTRKYAHTWELSGNREGQLIGVNTTLANRLIREAIAGDRIPSLAGYRSLRSEVKYGREASRIDLLLSEGSAPGARGRERRCFVEVKSVTLLEEPAAAGIGYFPDAVSTRAAKHLRELIGVVREGERAVLCFCVQHTGIREVRPADHIDGEYGERLREAIAEGVEVIAYGTLITPDEIIVTDALPVICPVR